MKTHLRTQIASRPFPRLMLLLLLLLFAAGCSRLGGGDERLYGHQVELTGESFLVCSDDCANRAQCGNSNEKGRVVLLSSLGPAGIRHDLSITENSAVSVLQVRQEASVPVMGGEPFSALYYEVATADRGTAWVAGWCLSSQPNQ